MKEDDASRRRAHVGVHTALTPPLAFLPVPRLSCAASRRDLPQTNHEKKREEGKREDGESEKERARRHGRGGGEGLRREGARP